jgi:hypothetical protein
MEKIKEKFDAFMKWCAEFDRKIRKEFHNVKHTKRFFRRFKTVDFRSWDIVDTLYILNFETFCEFYEHGNLDSIDWDSDVSSKKTKKKIDDLYNWYMHVIRGKWESHWARWEYYCNKYKVKKEEVVHDVRTYNTGGPTEEIIRDLLQEEQDLYKEEEKKMIELIKLRNCLWT